MHCLIIANITNVLDSVFAEGVHVQQVKRQIHVPVALVDGAIIQEDQGIMHHVLTSVDHMLNLPIVCMVDVYAPVSMVHLVMNPVPNQTNLIGASLDTLLVVD